MRHRFIFSHCKYKEVCQFLATELYKKTFVTVSYAGKKS